MSSSSRNLNRKRGHSSHSDISEESPQRQRLYKRRKSIARSSSSEDLIAEVDDNRIIDQRLRTRKLTKFQQNLERLKRRKKGRPSELSSRSEDESSPEEVLKHIEPTSDYDSLFDENSDSNRSSDFIVEDDDALPPSLPIQYSLETHEDLNHQFKKIFQFFVHIAVRPAKERHEFMEELYRKEDYFSIPLQVARRKLSGLRDSLVASSVWKPDFKGPIERYPEFDLIPLDFSVPWCDACRLGGRIATIVGRLGGLPYNPWGFEILDGYLNTDGNSDDDESRNSHVAPSTPTKATEFNLGRFCARRTRVYHEFTHWEFHLFKCIRDEVDDLHASQQSDGFFRIAYAGSKMPPEDLDDADGICEWLNKRKVIDMQWEKIKAMMNSARNLELASKKGEED